MVIYGVIQIVLSQIPNFHNLAILSLIAAVMSFAYSFIGIALSMTKLIQGNQVYFYASVQLNRNLESLLFNLTIYLSKWQRLISKR